VCRRASGARAARGRAARADKEENMGKIESRAARGTRDIMPAQMAGRRAAIKKIVDVFEAYGYEPLETPAIERLDVLAGKYGEEGDRLIFKIAPRGDGSKDAELGLRYDLTVPLARVVASHPEIKFPFKRYQIQPVWRAERPQKARYREFYQCDVDVVGVGSVTADAEIVAIVNDSLGALGFEGYRIRVNHRRLLRAIAEFSGTSSAKAVDLCIAIDKLERVGFDGVREELQKRGITGNSCSKVMAILEITGTTEDKLAALERSLGSIEDASVAIRETREFLACLAPLGVPASSLSFDPCLARGLDYYTGLIYESVVDEPRIGSLTGGGRYDKLIGTFAGREIPATGTTVGLERILAAMEDLGMLPQPKSGAQVLVAFQDESLESEALSLSRELRRAGMRCEVTLKSKSPLREQLAYAAAKDIPWVFILGPDELAGGVVSLRDMARREQRTVDRADAVTALASALSQS
jgi:histidyl-tRNA synthetase